MRLTDALMGEHGVFYAIFDQLEAALEGADSADQARALTGSLTAAVASHAAIENELLLGAMEATMGPAGPVAVMRDEHQRIEHGLAAMATESDVEEFRRIAADVIQLARAHFAKEEQVLFRMAVQQLGDETLHELGRQWAGRRGVSVE